MTSSPVISWLLATCKWLLSACKYVQFFKLILRKPILIWQFTSEELIERLNWIVCTLPWDFNSLRNFPLGMFSTYSLSSITGTLVTRPWLFAAFFFLWDELAQHSPVGSKGRICRLPPFADAGKSSFSRALVSRVEGLHNFFDNTWASFADAALDCSISNKYSSYKQLSSCHIQWGRGNSK